MSKQINKPKQSIEDNDNAGPIVFGSILIICVIALAVLAFLTFGQEAQASEDVPVDTVIEMVPAGSDESITSTTSKDNGGKCHVTLPAGTDVGTLKTIGYWMEQSGCNIQQWWSSIDIPFVGDNTSEPEAE